MNEKYAQMKAVLTMFGVEFVWLGSKYKPILVTHEYEQNGEIPKSITLVKNDHNRRINEYVRNDTRLGILLPAAYKFYYWLEWQYWDILGFFVKKLNRAGIMYTPLGACPSWKDFGRKRNE